MEKVGILGLGRVGRSLLSYLMGKDIEILLFDENREALAHRKIRFALDTGQARAVSDPAELSRVDVLLKSPGIPNDADWIKALDDAGVRMIDEIEFAWAELGKPVTVAITGTNGKSTTTAWTAELLKAAGCKTFCGGNLAPGRPFSEALGDMPYDVYVIEVSTFQLERCPTFRPNIGAVLNITADHLNRHSADEYVDLKLSLFKNHRETDVAVLNANDENISTRLASIPGQHRFFTLERNNAHACLEGSELILRGSKIIDKADLPVPGMHNVANALAAILIASELGASADAMRSGLMHFKGLPHRMQYLGEVGGRKVYNNSMCTNPVAFYNSIHAFDEPSVVIAGGTGKGLPLEPFVKGVVERAKFAVLFGSNSEKLHEILTKQSNFSSCVTVPTLGAAFHAALLHSQSGDRILFAPGFASFGNFKNFEERGNAFIKIVARHKRQA